MIQIRSWVISSFKFDCIFWISDCPNLKNNWLIVIAITFISLTMIVIAIILEVIGLMSQIGLAPNICTNYSDIPHFGSIPLVKTWALFPHFCENHNAYRKKMIVRNLCRALST